MNIIKHLPIKEALPFDKDLQRIVASRAFSKIREFRENLKVFGCGEKRPIPWDEERFWEAYFTTICERELFVILPGELQRYKKRYRHRKDYEYEKDINLAKGGDKGSLCRIIGWDKSWLSIEWVQNKIAEITLQAQETGDFELLRDIGDAISEKPGAKISVRSKRKEDKENNGLILALVETALIYHGEILPTDQSNPLLKKFHDVLVEQDFCPHPLFDPDYFPKFLRRHGLIR